MYFSQKLVFSKHRSFIIEGAIPGAYQNMCMNLSERKYILQSRKNQSIQIYQGSREANDQSSVSSSSSSSSTTLAGRTGVALWNSGLLLTRLLDTIQLSSMSDDAKSSSLLFQGKTVLELGCGTGFTSIVASKLGAKYVYATDGNIEALELAKTNLKRNGIYPFSSSDGNENLNVDGNGEACVLQWGSLDSIDFYETADVVLGSDLTYNSGSWRTLVDTIASVLKPNGYMLYLTLGHSGFNVSGEINGFLTVVQSSGMLEIVREDSSSWPFSGVKYLEELLLSSLTDSERAIVSGTGGMKILVLQQKRRNRR